MTASKSAAIIFSLIYASGFVWYPGDSFSAIDVLVLIVVVTALVVSLFPNEKISTLGIKYALLSAVFVGVVSLISIIVIDFSSDYSSGYVGSSLDFVFIVLFLFIGKGIYQKNLSQ